MMLTTPGVIFEKECVFFGREVPAPPPPPTFKTVYVSVSLAELSALSVTVHVYVKVPIVKGVDIPSGEFDEPTFVSTPDAASPESVPEHVHGKVSVS